MRVPAVTSFKTRLAAYFVALSLLPLAGAFWAFSVEADRSVRATADARLHAGLRAATAAFGDELEAAGGRAAAVASRPPFQRALRARDREALERILAPTPNIRVESGAFRVGAAPVRAAERRVAVVGAGRRAEVIGSVRLDAALLRRLRERSGLAGDDALAFAAGGRIVAGPSGTIGRDAPFGNTLATRDIGGDAYRGLAVRLVGDPPTSLVALTPERALVSERRGVVGRMLLALAAALAAIGAVAYLSGRSITSSLRRLVEAANALAAGRLDDRVDVSGRDELAALGRAFNEMADQLQQRLADLEGERERLREANARFGDALAATLDTDQLLRVIVETAVEATGAATGSLLADGREVVRVGSPEPGPARLELPLSAGRASFGTLVFTAAEFGAEERMTAASLAGQAVVALENARLHRIVERQALVDGLTGLANRRHLDDTLAHEIARAARFGGPLAFIIADLDDFKGVNDLHGHPTGDQVLRVFAEVLQESVREVDIAGRWGGEEFAVVLPGADVDGAVQVAERVREAIAARPVLAPDGTALRVTASLGVAAYPRHGSRDELETAADEALYEAKRGGKNRVVAAFAAPSTG